MAKLVYIGSNHANKGGLSSKAYTIRRCGKQVLARYGSVQSIGGKGGRLHWLIGWPHHVTWKFRSITAAADFVKSKISEKVKDGYEPLPGRVRIGHPVRVSV